jgi:HK97 family phage major capsid protein
VSKATLLPGRRAMLAAAGIDPGLVGRTFNTAPVIDVDKITIPDTPEALEDMLRDGKKINALFKGGQFPEFVAKYARVVVEKDRTLTEQITNEVERGIARFLKESKDKDGAVPINLGPSEIAASVHGHGPRTGRAAIYNRAAMGAAIDKEFESSAAYFRAIWHNTHPDSALQAKLHRIRNAFSSTVPSEGGFLIPETVRADLLMVALETAIVRPRAMVIPMETLRVPFPSVDETTHSGSLFGGIVCYWTEEGGALQDTSASFSRVILEAKKLTAYTAVPNELISDSPASFQAFLDQVLPQAIAFYEDVACFTGTGVGEPRGFLNANALVSVTKESGQAAATILWENIVKMYARMLPSSLNRAVWVASIDTFPELATMALSVGTGGSAIWLNNGVAGPPMTILGRPVIFTEKAKVLGTAGDINFVDFGYYLMGDRQVMSAMSSPHFKFQNDQTAFRIIERVDGQPWIQSAITPQNGGATLSPYVTIETRS